MKYVRHSLEVDAVQYELGKGLEDGFQLYTKVLTNGYIIAAVNDYSKLSFTFEYVNLKPEENGTVSVHEAIKSEREIAE